MFTIFNVQTKNGMDKVLLQQGTIIKETESDIYLLFADGRCKIPREQYERVFTGM
jgi:hypothetical protein